MEAASKALDCLSKSALTELKSLSNPPAGVELVTKACLMMIENENRNFKWDRAKKMMANIDKFLESLKSFDARNMDDKLIEKLSIIISNPTFTFANMEKKSSAAANLCNWVCNIFKYNRIYVNVKPLMLRLEQANQDKVAAEDELSVVRRVVLDVEHRLSELKRCYVKATEEKMAVEKLAQDCLIKLDLANRLVHGLGSENVRWEKEIEKLEESERSLIASSVLAAAFVSYLGGFDSSNRQKLWRDIWLRDLIERDIPMGPTERLDPLEFLSNTILLAEMMQDGLPGDRISLENGAILTTCERWPLIIDPQEQALSWLKRKFRKDAEVNVPVVANDRAFTNFAIRERESQIFIKTKDAFRLVHVSSDNWEDETAMAIENGEVLLIENLGESIPTTLDPLLAKEITKRGSAKVINFGGKAIQYDDRFRLFLFTRLPSPHYKPELQAQCTLIDFTATEIGFEEQILVEIVQAECPDKEKARRQLEWESNNYMVRLKCLEDTLLQKLLHAPEDILSDVPLIESLETTKSEVAKIDKAVHESHKLLFEIASIRDSFRIVAREVSMLYFLLIRLDKLDWVYQYSLDSFMRVFKISITKSPSTDILADRINSLRSTIRLNMYMWVSRGLFEKHKLLFLSMLCFNLMRKELIPAHTTWSEDAYSFFLQRPEVYTEENPVKDWLPDPCWNSLQALAKIDAFSSLPNDIVEAPARFREWHSHPCPERERLPLDWAQLERTPFLKLFIVQCLRPDRIIFAIEEFVKGTLPDSKAYMEYGSTLNARDILQQAYMDSTSGTPIFFVLVPGSDIVGDVDSLAEAEGMEKGKRYFNISMGQGQGVIAEEHLKEGTTHGHWLLLNNIHLMPVWSYRLVELLETYKTEGSNDKFRLFISSERSVHIPVDLIARSVKIINEPPSGLKANLKRAFCSLPKSFIDETDSRTKAAYFGLCYFHAVLTERKKFGSMGFNFTYPFSLSDLRDSAACLNAYMDNSSGSGLPWTDLQYIFGEIIYGGHIFNDFDQLLANSLLAFYMKDELLDEMELYPFNQDDVNMSFKAPLPTTYSKYLEYIDESITLETPAAFGIHPNAEIKVGLVQSLDLSDSLKAIEAYSAANVGGRELNSPQLSAEITVNEILDRYSECEMDVRKIKSNIPEMGPFETVFLQEIQVMNVLLQKMMRSLHELTFGLAGELTISDEMESLMNSIFLNDVPTSWTKLAWPSLRRLSAWMNDLNMRLSQLNEWILMPKGALRVTWISGLINPVSFMTAVKQMSARKNKIELDQLILHPEVTKKYYEDCDQESRDGFYVHGFFMQGARWDIGNGNIERAKSKEIHVSLPVVNFKAVTFNKTDLVNTFCCPCYKTEQRGATFVFSTNLKSKSPPLRWIIAGVALILDVVQ